MLDPKELVRKRSVRDGNDAKTPKDNERVKALVRGDFQANQQARGSLSGKTLHQ
jgi:hypothetical protein